MMILGLSTTFPSLTCDRGLFACAGLKPTAEAFFLFMFSVILVSYTATSMALAIAADQTVVAIANIFMTIACVFMMVTRKRPHSLPASKPRPLYLLLITTNSIS